MKNSIYKGGTIIYKSKFGSFAWNIEAGELLENFFIAAISSILVIRAFLKISGYPQIGNGDFHIAHMLWGGFFMFGALVINFVSLNKEAKKIAAVIGGIGFGTFIDELGKFITSNNDYFFQPTIALIYVVFVLFFLSMRLGEHFIKLSDKCYAINALEVIKEIILYDLDKNEKKRALYFLSLSDKNNQAVIVLKKLLKDIDALPLSKPGLLTLIKRSLSAFYIKTISFKWFNKFLIYFFVLNSLFGFSKAILDFKFSTSFFELGYLLSVILSGAIVLVGVYYVRKNQRLLAYEMFKYSIMVSIFLTQLFLFYQEQLSAIIYLVFNLTIFAVLQYLQSQERITTANSEK